MLHQAVVAAPSRVMSSTGWTMRAWIASEVQPLTLVAPPPVRLTGAAPCVEDQFVVPAAGLIVGAARRAVRARVAAEVHALTLMTPSPVVLSRRGCPVVNDVVVATA